MQVLASALVPRCLTRAAASPPAPESQQANQARSRPDGPPSRGHAQASRGAGPPPWPRDGTTGGSLTRWQEDTARFASGATNGTARYAPAARVPDSGTATAPLTLHTSWTQPLNGLSTSLDGKVGLFPTTFTSGSEAPTLAHLQGCLNRWPTLEATVAFGPDGQGNTTAIIAGRPQDVSAVSLQGVHKVMARLASSPDIKYAAQQYNVTYQPAAQLTPEAVKVRLPGVMDASELKQALSYGFAANPTDLGVKLPPGRVALLIAGPSAAGKTTLAEKLQPMLPDRRVVAMQCDMYYRDWDDPDYPKTSSGTLFWDNPEAMHMGELSKDIATLLRTGKASVPVFDFKTGHRKPERQELELGENDVLVLDSMFASNPRIVDELESGGLPHVTLFMDTERGEDRLVRRIVRDYEQRGAAARFTYDCWELTTRPGEVKYVRPTLLNLDPAHDGFYRSQLPTDPGLSVPEIEVRVKELEARKVKPTYEAFA